MKTEIQEYLMSVLVNEFHLPIDPDTAGERLELGPGGLNIGSLTFVDLAFRIEDRYGFSIPDDDQLRIAAFSLGDLVAYIEGKLSDGVPEGATS